MLGQRGLKFVQLRELFKWKVIFFSKGDTIKYGKYKDNNKEPFFLTCMPISAFFGKWNSILFKGPCFVSKERQ